MEIMESGGSSRSRSHRRERVRRRKLGVVTPSIKPPKLESQRKKKKREKERRRQGQGRKKIVLHDSECWVDASKPNVKYTTAGKIDTSNTARGPAGGASAVDGRLSRKYIRSIYRVEQRRIAKGEGSDEEPVEKS
jgi:hypothetical protein